MKTRDRRADPNVREWIEAEERKRKLIQINLLHPKQTKQKPIKWQKTREVLATDVGKLASDYGRRGYNYAKGRAYESKAIKKTAEAAQRAATAVSDTASSLNESSKKYTPTFRKAAGATARTGWSWFAKKPAKAVWHTAPYAIKGTAQAAKSWSEGRTKFSLAGTTGFSAIFVIICWFVAKWSITAGYKGFVWTNVGSKFFLVLPSVIISAPVIFIFLVKIVFGKTGEGFIGSFKNNGMFFLFIAYFATLYSMGIFSDRFSLIHITLYLIYYIIVISKMSDQKTGYLILIFMTFTDLFGTSLIAAMWPSFPIIPWLPFWISLYSVKYCPHAITQILFIILMMNMIVDLAGGLPYLYGITRDYLTAGEQDDARNMLSWSYWYKRMRNVTDESLRYATGGYYQSEVREEKGKPLGIHVSSLITSDSIYYKNEPISLWATVKATSKDMTEVPVKFGCGVAKTEMTGQVVPNNEGLTIKNGETIDVNCLLDRNLEKGVHTVYFKTIFEFNGNGTWKNWFVDGDQDISTRTLTREATSTGGPVRVGVGGADDVIKVFKPGTDRQIRPIRVGVTLENMWDEKVGQIKEVKEILIRVPKGVEIEFCDYAPEYLSDKDVYSIKDLRDFKEISELKTFNCRAIITEYSDLIGDIGKDYLTFNADVTYVYQTKEELNVQIKEEERENYFGDKTYERDDFGCSLIEAADECKEKSLCFAEYEKQDDIIVFTKCSECDSSRRDCSSIFLEDYCEAEKCMYRCAWNVERERCDKLEDFEYIWPFEDKRVFECDGKNGIKVLTPSAANTVKSIDKGFVVENKNNAVEIEHYPGFRSRYINVESNLNKYAFVDAGSEIGKVIETNDNAVNRNKNLYYGALIMKLNGIGINPLKQEEDSKRGYFYPNDYGIIFAKDWQCCQTEMKAFCDLNDLGIRETFNYRDERSDLEAET